jgi:23S rRNA pseudouridine2605 synthase
MAKVRLNKALAEAGIASRRNCDAMICDGRVTVNGKKVDEPFQRIEWNKDTVTLDGEKVTPPSAKRYFLINKPLGYVCSNDSSRHAKIVVDIFEGIQERLFTVGRLDKNTTGLLLVTNDGDFAQRVIHPSHNIQKEYVARVNRELSDSDLKKLSEGTFVEGVFVKPYSVKKMRKGTVKIVVMEGKKREVRMILENAGFTVETLKRTRIGNLRLGNTVEGSWKEVSLKDLENIFV